MTIVLTGEPLWRCLLDDCLMVESTNACSLDGANGPARSAARWRNPGPPFPHYAALHAGYKLQEHSYSTQRSPVRNAGHFAPSLHGGEGGMRGSRGKSGRLKTPHRAEIGISSIPCRPLPAIPGSSPGRARNAGAQRYAAVLADGALAALRVFSCASAARISERLCCT